MLITKEKLEGEQAFNTFSVSAGNEADLAKLREVSKAAGALGVAILACFPDHAPAQTMLQRLREIVGECVRSVNDG